MFDRVQYNGYEIDVVPHKLADEPSWTTNIYIWKHKDNCTLIRNFSAGNLWNTKRKAMRHCLDFGRKIVDGQMANCTVADM